MTALIPIQNLRSNVASKRPAASGLSYGQIAINYNSNDPAVYLRSSTDALVKISPVYIGSGAPNATPASGGTSGNAIGEQWLDTTSSGYVLKIWDGAVWRGIGVTSAVQWSTPRSFVYSGDVTASGVVDGSEDESFVTTIANGAVTPAKLDRPYASAAFAYFCGSF